MPTKHFTEWTVEDAQKALIEPLNEAVGAAGLTSNRAFVEDGDHWQDGDTWVGALGSDILWAATIKAQVLRQFTPVDLLGEVLDRIRDALIKREPSIDLAPRAESGVTAEDASEEDDEERDEVLRALAAWWDAKRLWPSVGDAIKRSRWATRGALRFWVPPGRRAEDGTLPTGLPLADALDLLEITSPDPEYGGVYIDEDTREEVAVFVYTDDEGKTTAELWWAADPTSERDGELDDATMVKVLGTEDAGDPIAIQGTGGALPISSIEGELLITEAVRRQQNRLNFFESLLNRVAETGGFPERYTLNAKPGGIWIKGTAPTSGRALDTYTDPVSGETWYLHESPVTIGAGVTTRLVGIDGGGEQGGPATPGVVFRDPTDPEFAIKSAKHARSSILSQCKQGHLVNESRAESSGLAYQQARSDHENDLEGTRIEVEAMVRTFLESAIAWAAVMSTEAAGILEKYRVVVNLHVNAGPLSSEERRTIVEEWKQGLKSRETALSELGVEDVMAEVDRLDQELRAGVELRQKQAQIFGQLLAVGVEPAAAAAFAGLDEEEEADGDLIAQLTRGGNPLAAA